MADGDAKREEEKKKEPEKECGEFRIRDFPDLRRLRKAYLKCGDKPVAVDSSDTPLPDDSEEDFGLKRSTEEEAWQFLRDSTAPENDHAADDPMREFLEDE